MKIISFIIYLRQICIFDIVIQPSKFLNTLPIALLRNEDDELGGGMKAAPALR